MNGVHDMGGMHNFDSVDTADDARFHGEWERIVFAMDKALLAGDVVNLDEKRHAIECIPPGDYLNGTYFERWLAGIERNLRDRGYLSDGEVDDRADVVRGADDPAALVPERTDSDLAAAIREAFEAPAGTPQEPEDPEFGPGDAVRVRNVHPEGHTRCPRCARRATGTVGDVRGAFTLPDASAHGDQRVDPVYSVAFEAGELWGPDAENPEDTVRLDLWEPYLERT
jgi:nitrile hydratase